MKRTLFVTSNRLGDAVLTTGVLEYLAVKEPDVQVTVVCGHIPADIFKNFRNVETVIPISKKKYSLHWWSAFRKSGHFFWHRIVDFRGSALGYLPTSNRHLWLGGSDTEHKLISNAKVIGKNEALSSKIHLPPEIAKRHLIAEDNIDVLAIAPTANSWKKQWHYENYIELALRLTDQDGVLPGARILVLGAPGEEEQAMPVVEALPQDRVLNFVGKTTPVEAAQLLSQTKLFVGNDSGLMHTAVAVDVPTVGLFGIGKPAVYGPWGPRALCLTGTPVGEQITRREVLADDGESEVIETLPVEYVLEEVQTFYRSLS